MASPFARTLRSLNVGRRPPILEGIFGCFLAIWFFWLFAGRVGVYLVSVEAHLAVEEEPHVITAPVDGIIHRTSMAVGLPVREGDVLLRLDQEDLKLSLLERKTQREAKEARLTAVQMELETERRSTGPQERALEAALAEARAQMAEARAKLDFAEQHLNIFQGLAQSKAISADELSQARADALSARARLEATRQSLAKLEFDRKYQVSQEEVRQAHLQREAIELEQNIRVDDSAIKHLEYQIELRIIRAPVTGRVGEVVATFQAGAAVKSADRLGAVVPNGTPRVVAAFAVADSGRIRPGQPARLRLDGFAWSEYGTMPAIVTQVGNEPIDGRFRVELAIQADPMSPLPREHGLSGSVEVEVEQVSPFGLMLRAAGQMVTRPVPPPPPTSTAPERPRSR
jgi:membrane fusion protein (multidrug efflux system)